LSSELSRLALEKGRLSLTLTNGRLVFEAPVERVHAKFPLLGGFTVFDVEVDGVIHRITVICSLPDPTGIGAARRIGRAWRNALT
jgi:hypothetical protein